MLGAALVACSTDTSFGAIANRHHLPRETLGHLRGRLALGFKVVPLRGVYGPVVNVPNTFHIVEAGPARPAGDPAHAGTGYHGPYLTSVTEPCREVAALCAGGPNGRQYDGSPGEAQA